MKYSKSHALSWVINRITDSAYSTYVSNCILGENILSAVKAGSALFFYFLVKNVCMHGVLKLPYSQKIWQGVKFGGLAVRVETAKLKSANIIFACNTCNDVMHAVALLAPLSALLCELYI